MLQKLEAWRALGGQRDGAWKGGGGSLGNVTVGEAKQRNKLIENFTNRHSRQSGNPGVEGPTAYVPAPPGFPPPIGVEGTLSRE